MTFPPRQAGGPHTLDARTATATVRSEDILIGDVWVLSGQSNMQWVVADSEGADTTVAGADDDRIRHLRVPRSHAEAPQRDITGGTWEPALPEFVGDFSGVGYFFAQALRETQHVPIGLVHASWGGSRIEPWMSARMLGLNEPEAEKVFQQVEVDLDAREDALLNRLGGSFPSGAADPDAGLPQRARADYDDSDWATLRVPARWESAGYDGLDGIAWYRTTVTLSPDEAAQEATLSLGIVDDGHHAYVNGVLVGKGRGTREAWAYPVPASVLRPGSNTIAVRVEDRGGGGGLKGGRGLLYVETDTGTRHSLVGDWRFRVAEATFGRDAEINKTPMLLWNQMIAPLTASPITGVLWYQGESNANEPEAYRTLFRSLIRGWRTAWDQPEMPFYWVQLAGYRQPPERPDDVGSWPALRAAQSAALALPATAEVLALDVGDADDIHPRDKRTVGRRLARVARTKVYGEEGVVMSGPRFRVATRQGPQVTVAFDEVGDGLSTRQNAPLGGFALQDEEGAWHWAEARIDGHRVVLEAPGLSHPTAVRYAWADNPVGATLVNEAGLPASPFSAVLPDW